MSRPTPPAFSDVPEGIRALVARICEGLPEAQLADNGAGYVLRVRRRSFGTLLAVRAPDTGALQTLLVVHADPEEQQALVAIGHPYFPIRNSGSRIGILVDAVPDEAEIAELVTEAYCQVAPKKLVAALPDPSG